MWTLVTGGGKHLGAALSIALAEKGHSVAVHYNHSQKEALDIAAECRALGVQAEAIQGDFNSLAGTQDFIKRYLDQFPQTDILINNVGNYLIRSASQTSCEEWLSLFQTNLHAPFLLTQALLPALMCHKGQVINVGVAGLHRHAANTYCTAYTLTKQALLGLTLSLARELAPQGIRVNMVSPGELDISVDHHTIPMKRPATYSEFVRVVNFLLDPDSSYITGQNIEVAGGLAL